jgi:hypothetical protein
MGPRPKMTRVVFSGLLVWCGLGEATTRSSSEALLDWLRPRVDASCEADLSSFGFELTISGRAYRSEVEVDSLISKKAVLCRVQSQRSTGKIAIVSFATSMAYLRSNGTHRFEDKWGSLVQRDLYAAKHDYVHYLWLGNLDDESVKANEKCAEVSTSAQLGHIVKTLAVLYVLDCSKADAVLYADVDS